MKRAKKLYILLGVLVLACIATFVLTRMEDEKEQIKASGETILSLDSSAVTALSWQYDDESLSFHKDGSWSYDDDDSFPVSEDVQTATFCADSGELAVNCPNTAVGYYTADNMPGYCTMHP